MEVLWNFMFDISPYIVFSVSSLFSVDGPQGSIIIPILFLLLIDEFLEDFMDVFNK